MKKIIYSLLIVIISSACSNSGGDDSGGDETPVENKAPSKVSSLIYPSDNLLCIINTLEFKWAASSDPDGDIVSYVLEISEDNQFSSIDESFIVSTNSKTVTLEKGKAFYWRVQSKDNKDNKSDFSSIYQFYTEGEAEVNHLPFSPQLISPQENNEVSGVTVSLKWNGSDVDGDALKYDVFFGTTSNPTSKIGDNISEKEISASITSNTTYYWKVIVKDDSGGQSIGQIWSFKTI